MQDQTKPTAASERRKPVSVPGHPGIYRKGRGYQVRWRYKGRQKARSFRTLTEAARYKAQVAAGDTQPSSRQPFRRYAEAWVEQYVGRTAKGISDSTRDSYRDSLKRYAIPFFGSVRLDEIDAPLLKDFIAYLARGNHMPATVRRYYAPVSALLATAYEDGLLKRNPAQGVRVIVRGDWNQAPKRRLTPEETRLLLSEIPTEHADLVYLLAAAGVRIDEALSTEWRDLGLDREGRPALTIRVSKTPSGLRELPLSPEAASRLVRRRSAAPLSSDNDPIFPNRAGRKMDDHNFRRRVFRPAAARAGLPWATPHALRHGLATLMADCGYSPAHIAAQLGHGDGGVLALKTYIRPTRLDAPTYADEAFGSASSR